MNKEKLMNIIGQYDVRKDLLEDIADDIILATNNNKPVCEWKQPKFEEYNIYETDCGNTFNLEIDTPKDNNMDYCCYCGKELKQRLA